MTKLLERLGHSPIMSPRNFQYICAISGILCLVLLFVGLGVSGFIPPIPPTWDAEQTVKHYQDHVRGVQAGAALMVISGMCYILLSAALSAQMRRIPNLHYAVSALQLASGTAGAMIFILMGIFLAATNYPLDRPPEITRAFNDLFWICTTLTWPPFMAQNLCFAYTVILDSRPNALSPKPVALFNIFVSILFIPSIAVHCVTKGPLAWNGVFTFWIVGFTGALPIIIDCMCVARAASIETGIGEKIEFTPLLA